MTYSQSPYDQRKNHVSQGSSWKAVLTTFFFVYLLLAIILSVLVKGILEFNASMEIATLKTHEVTKANVAAYLLEHESQLAVSDLIVFARIPSLTRYINNDNSAELSRIAESFKNLIDEKQIYDQIIFIDLHGKPVVTSSLSGYTLNDMTDFSKIDSPYHVFFLKTLALTNKKVNISLVDNQHNQQTASSTFPIMFLGTPVIDKTGKKQGIVILTITANKLLNDFYAVLKNSKHVILVNQSGYSINIPTKEAHINLINTANFAMEYPDEWAEINENNEGNILTDQGLFSYATASSYSLIANHDPELFHQDENQNIKPPEKEKFWKIITFISSSELPNASVFRTTFILVIYLTSLILLLLLSLYISVIMVHRRKVSYALRESTKEIHDLYENAPCGYHSLSSDGTYIRINNTELRWLKYTRDEIVGIKKFPDLLAPQSMAHFKENFIKLQKQGYIEDQEYEMIRKNGSVFTVLLSTTAIRDHSGNLIRTRSTLFDISKRKLMEYALRESEERFRSVMDNAPIGMAIVSLDGNFLCVNQSLCEFTGYHKEELEKLSFQQITYPEDLTIDLPNTKKLIDNELTYYKREKRYIRKDGNIVWAQLTVTAVKDNTNGKPLYFISQIENIAERKMNQEKIHQLAYHDSLTRLPNRQLLLDRINHAIAQSERQNVLFAIIFMDIDGFKQINDALGHDIGDELLQEVAVRLVSSVRNHDTVARHGGDEFVIILNPVSHQGDIDKIAKKILSIFDTPFQIRNYTLNTSSSIGIAIYPFDGKTTTQLIKNADIAMYKSKNDGKNQYQFYSESAVIE